MIKSFSCTESEKIFNGKHSKKLPSEIQKRILLKLRQIHNANGINDLRIPPSNHLEALRGNLAGFHSIRVNRQWRIVFRWNDGSPTDVEVTDYH